jgi:hypothetical protein
MDELVEKLKVKFENQKGMIRKQDEFVKTLQVQLSDSEKRVRVLENEMAVLHRKLNKFRDAVKQAES